MTIEKIKILSSANSAHFADFLDKWAELAVLTAVYLVAPKRPPGF
jgi:hypothetical protein